MNNIPRPHPNFHLIIAFSGYPAAVKISAYYSKNGFHNSATKRIYGTKKKQNIVLFKNAPQFEVQPAVFQTFSLAITLPFYPEGLNTPQACVFFARKIAVSHCDDQIHCKRYALYVAVYYDA